MDTQRILKVDVAVIGSGTGGLGARRAAEKAGATTVMIEDGPYGTTCARVGCMPSKLLIAAADAAHEARHADRFGVHASAIEVNGPEVMARVQRERDRFVGFVVQASERIPEALRLHGRARFVDATTLEVSDGTRVEAKAVVVATGSTPWLPPVLRDLGDRVMTNDHIFEMNDLPDSVAVVGTGVIGLELGQALDRLGVRVRLFSRSAQIGPVTDPVVLAKMQAVFSEALTLSLDTPIDEAERVDDGVVLRWRDAEGAHVEERFDYVLAATGRRPSVEDLHLVKARISLDPRGVPYHCAQTMQCGERGVFLAGDVTNTRTLLHEAADEARIAGANAARFATGQAVRNHRRRTPLGVVFSHPQIATVGLSYAELDEKIHGIGEVSYDNQGRARVMGQNKGHVRIYGARACGTLVGAEMFGPAVEHTAHLLAWAVQQRMTVTEALRMPFYHPVIEEGIRTALRSLAAELKLADHAEIDCLDCPGS